MLTESLAHEYHVVGACELGHVEVLVTDDRLDAWFVGGGENTGAAVRIKTRKIDQGDGTFKEKQECTEPVEQCSYTVTKWKVQRTLKETGEGVDSTPKWPEVKLNRTGKCVGCEREGDRKETYLVHFKEAKSNDKLSCSFSKPAKWKSFEVGTTYKGEKHGLGGDLDCDSLKKGK